MFRRVRISKTNCQIFSRIAIEKSQKKPSNLISTDDKKSNFVVEKLAPAFKKAVVGIEKSKHCNVTINPKN